jgi:hypothetical protein
MHPCLRQFITKQRGMRRMHKAPQSPSETLQIAMAVQILPQNSANKAGTLHAIE